MPLVDYSDSEESQEDDILLEQGHPAKLKKSVKRKHSESTPDGLPPLPEAFHDLYTTSTRVSTEDDPALHGGRQRAIPHVEGNWPTHVYVEWYPSNTESAKLKQLIHSLNVGHDGKDMQIRSLLESELGAEMPLHISLSRSLILASNQREPFIDGLKLALEDTITKPFDVHVAGLQWVANFEATRWFLVLQLVKPDNDDLNLLLLASNQTAMAFDQPWLYGAPEITPEVGRTCERGSKHPRTRKGKGFKEARVSSHVVGGYTDFSSSFHISIAWSLSRPSEEVVGKVRAMDVSDLKNIRLTIRSIKAKVGNAVSTLTLAVKALESRGILGT